MSMSTISDIFIVGTSFKTVNHRVDKNVALGWAYGRMF
jgi:hypothetical protein